MKRANCKRKSIILLLILSLLFHFVLIANSASIEKEIDFFVSGCSLEFDNAKKNDLIKIANIMGVYDIDKIVAEDDSAHVANIVVKVYENADRFIDNRIRQRILAIAVKNIHNSRIRKSGAPIVEIGEFYTNKDNISTIESCRIDDRFYKNDIIVGEGVTCNEVTKVLKSMRQNEIVIPETLREEFLKIDISNIVSFSLINGDYSIYIRRNRGEGEELIIEEKDNNFFLKTILTSFS